MEPALVTHPAGAQQKALGAFYTPSAMAEKMVEWAIRSRTDRALDPSFGGLVFLRAADERLARLGAESRVRERAVFGCDLDSAAHASAGADGAFARATLVEGDFLALRPGAELPCVDAVIGNPPYVRYQLHNRAGASGRVIADAAGLDFTRLASSWAPFVVHSAEFVAPGGRLALVLPAELMHAQYAGDVLTWVQQRFARVALVLFEQRVFPGALEEVVLLFADGRGEGAADTIEVVECNDLAALDVPALDARMRSPSSRRPGRGKLLGQLLTADAQRLYYDLAGDARVRTLRSLASVDIGVVTGANDFFVLKRDDRPELDPSLLRPAITKAVHVAGSRLTADDLTRITAAGGRCRMLTINASTEAEALVSAQDYLAEGKQRGVDQRYKCRVRSSWYALPVPFGGTPPDLFLTYCSAEFPRMAVNEAAAQHTNTVHGVRVAAGIDPIGLAFGFYNALTMLSAELVGRSYGGGVLKLEPTEAEALLVPPLIEPTPEASARLDALIRRRDLSGALDVVDRVVLVEGLGLAADDVQRLRDGAERLRSRRRARGRAPR